MLVIQTMLCGAVALQGSTPSLPPVAPGVLHVPENEVRVWLLVVVAAAAPAVAFVLLLLSLLYSRARATPVLRQVPRQTMGAVASSAVSSASGRAGPSRVVYQQELFGKGGTRGEISEVSLAQSASSPRGSRGYSGQSRREYFSSR